MWMGRGLALAMTDPAQADAALSLCRMEPTDDRSSFLRDAGPSSIGAATCKTEALWVCTETSTAACQRCWSDRCPNTSAGSTAPIRPASHVARRGDGRL